ncbi:MAG: alkyl hydroperoxide reductase [Bacteroidetes bacterium]|nr:MAG: alkyl hydroperoxide reductase [Bacteroidota bacterium]
MNKKCLLYLLLSFSFLSAFSQANNSKPFTISGDLKKVKQQVESVLLYYVVNGQAINDSCKVVGGKYSFKGNLAEPTISRMKAVYKVSPNTPAKPVNQARDLTYLFIQSGKLTVSHVDSFSNIQVTGSPAHTDFKKIQTLAKPFNLKLQALYAKYAQYRNSGDMVNMRNTEISIDSLSRVMNDKVCGDFLRSNPNSPIAIFALQQYAADESVDMNKVDSFFNSLPESAQSTPAGRELRARIDNVKNTQIGAEAIDFTQNDTSGNPVKLSSFRGKYLLIDFWASWCGPCRQENPNVVRAFAKYKDKGFYILGVSLDRPDGKEKWLKAIHDDGLVWTHVSDLLYWNNAVARLYGIQSIPQNFLLDPNGKIIGKNLRGEELERSLEKIFGN